MISTWIVVFLTLLCVANVFLICVLAYSGRGKTNKEARVGLGIMAAVLVLNMLFSIGGVVLW